MRFSDVSAVRIPENVHSTEGSNNPTEDEQNDPTGNQISSARERRKLAEDICSSTADVTERTRNSIRKHG